MELECYHLEDYEGHTEEYSLVVVKFILQLKSFPWFILEK